MCPREITLRHRRGWLLVLRESIICANAGPRSRHPQWQSSPCLLAMSPGAHALARRARSHCSFSTILHVADSSAEERHFGAPAACRLRAGRPGPCSPGSTYAPLHRDYSCRASHVPSSTQIFTAVSCFKACLAKLLSCTTRAAPAAPCLVARGKLLWMLSVCISLTCRSRNVSSFHVCVAPRLCASMWECGQPSSSSRRPYVARLSCA